MQKILQRFFKNPHITQHIKDRIATQEYRNTLTEALLLNCYPAATDSAVLSESILKDIDEHLEKRILIVETKLIPWLTDVYDLRKKTILEIGCGTGSMTIPFAFRSKQVIACDVWEALEVARERAKLFKCSNVTFLLNDYSWLNRDQSVVDFFNTIPEFDVITLDAVLEHLTIEERLRVLKFSWERLKVGGVMVVYETPNRLAYYDSHTYLDYFFHALPDELAKLYALRFSPRSSFHDELQRKDWKDRLYKSGRGVSYHEFKLAIDFDKASVLADGLSPYLVSEDKHDYYRVLKHIFETELQHIPVGFSTEWIYLILRKESQ